MGVVSGLFLALSLGCAFAMHRYDSRLQSYRRFQDRPELYRLQPNRMLDEGLYVGEGRHLREKAVRAFGLMLAFWALFAGAMALQI